MLDALTAHTHEHYGELVRMPWKVFCIKWVRLIHWSAKERDRRNKEKREREWAKLKAEHANR